ncbi:uncharacterized protein LOC144444723 [Glandiceps talaboti]
MTTTERPLSWSGWSPERAPRFMDSNLNFVEKFWTENAKEIKISLQSQSSSVKGKEGSTENIVFEDKKELSSPALICNVQVHKKMRLLSLMDSDATVEKLQNQEWDNSIPVCPDPVDHRRVKSTEINSNTEFGTFSMPSDSTNKNEYDLNIDLDSAYHSTYEINENHLEKSYSEESIDSNCADYCLNIASTESFTLDNTRTRYGHGRPHSEDPTRSRSIVEIRESLEQKVKRLREEKAEVDEKIRLAQEEDIIRSQEKVKFQQQLALHRKERLKRVIGGLRKKLDDQSHRLQEGYNNVLLVKRNLMRSRSFAKRDRLERNDSREAPF